MNNASAEDAFQVPTVGKLEDNAYYLLRKEYKAIQQTRFASTTERLRVLQESRDAFDIAVELLKHVKVKEKNLEGAADRPDAPSVHRAREKAVREVLNYVRVSVYSGFKAVRSIALRRSFLDKTKSIRDEKLQSIAEIYNSLTQNASPQEVEKIESKIIAVEETTATESTALLSKTRSHQATNSKEFSEWIRKNSFGYHEIVEKYSPSGRSFSSLEDDEKMAVFDDVGEAAGRNMIKFGKIYKTVSITQFLFLGGLIVWDIVTANDKVLATKNVWTALGAIAGNAVGEAVATAAFDAGLVGVVVASGNAAGLAVVGGLISGIIAAAVVFVFSSLFDLVVGAFTLKIPEELRTSLVSVLTVPLDSALTEHLTTSLTTSLYD